MTEFRKCNSCNQPAGPRTKTRCDYHAGYNAGFSLAFMRFYRGENPDYREQEREAVRKRMRKLRAAPGYVRPEKREMQ